MKIAYFDCLSGISGNMTIGALLACGLDEATLRAGLAQLHLPGWELHVEHVNRLGIAAVHVDVNSGEHHPHRHLGDILGLIDASDLSMRVKEMGGRIFTRLAEAEAVVHGTTPDHVHFHEVGAVDAIVDIIGAAIGLEALGIDRVIGSPLPLGRGWVTCAHGIFPIPAPATAELVRGVPIAETDIEAELVTPTGAAMITTLAESFGPIPAMTLQAVGYGAGTRELPRPNVLRLFIGETTTAATTDTVVGLETNLDDVPGETLGYLMDRLFAVGALDVFYTPIMMKKNRPAVMVQVLCAPPGEAACTDILFRETTTLGIRRTIYDRTILPRETQTVETPFGPIRVKLSTWHDHVRREPEYEDCRRAAETHDIPLHDVYNSARSR